MIMTIGTGSGVENGIAKSIDQSNPLYIVFLATEKSKETISKLEGILKRKFEKSEHEIRIIDDENDAEKCYMDALESIAKLKKENYEVSVDFTSGTKAMTGGLILGAIVQEINTLIYVMGDRDDRTGRVITGTERIYTSPSPTRISEISIKN